MRKKYLVLWFIVAAVVAMVAQTNLKIRYWFDYDSSNIHTVDASTNEIHIEAEVAESPLTLSTIHIQAIDGDILSSPHSQFFINTTNNKDSRGIRYWFDTDSNYITVEGNVPNTLIDVGSLKDGLHSIHIQTIGDSPSSVISRLFFKSVEKRIENIRYWFDTDSNFITVEGNISNTLIDVSSLREGLHSIHIQTMGDAPSSVLTRLFVKPLEEKIGKVSYWFDQDVDNIYELQGTIIDEEIDVSQLSDGLHFIHLLLGENGVLPTQSRFFLKVPSMDEKTDAYILSYIDGEFISKDKIDNSTGLIHLDLDVTSLSYNLHLYKAQLLTTSGKISTSAQSFFYRVPTPRELDGMECYYSIGNSNLKNIAGKYSDDTYHFDINVSEMPEGIQRVSAFLGNDKGIITGARTAFFTKIPLGANGISQYAYWVNNDVEKMDVVKVDESSVINELTELITVESYPLSSKRFHFEIKYDGKPIIYAKNQFNIRIFDRSYRCSRDSAEYVDVNVSREITEIEPIESLVPKTKNVPGENEIHWFKTQASARDSMAIKASSACMMEIFSSTGERLYEVSGKKSTVLDGCRVTEDGTYYIALHDMDTQKTGNVTLTYQLFDKLPLGDANGDGLVNVTDVSTTIDHILGRKPANFIFVDADVDKDKEISVADVSLITDIVLGNDINSYLKTLRVAPLGEYYPPLVSVDDFIIRNNHDETLYIKVEDYEDFIAAQLDLHLPEGLSITDVTLVNENSASHSIAWRRLEQSNDYRLIAFSMGNHNFASSDIIAVTVHADENAAVDGANVILNNIVLNSYDEKHSIIKQQFVADTMCTVYGDITSTAQVGNDDWSFRVEGLSLYINVPSSCTKVLTDTLGRFCVLYLNEGENVVDVLSPGVYILDGKKIIVK